MLIENIINDVLSKGYVIAHGTPVFIKRLVKAYLEREVERNPEFTLDMMCVVVNILKLDD